PPPAMDGADRRGALDASARTGLHVLGLPGRCLAARPRPAHRPRAALARAGGAAGVSRPRQDGAESAAAVGSCAGGGGHPVARVALAADGAIMSVSLLQFIQPLLDIVNSIHASNIGD